jgi:hypothetical protein
VKKAWAKPFKKRNDEIIKRIDNGEARSDLARDFGISRQRVHIIFWREQ